MDELLALTVIADLALSADVWSAKQSPGFGGVGLHEANRTGSGKGIATAGLILGIITVLVTLFMVLVVVAARLG